MQVLEVLGVVVEGLVLTALGPAVGASQVPCVVKLTDLADGVVSGVVGVLSVALPLLAADQGEGDGAPVLGGALVAPVPFLVVAPDGLEVVLDLLVVGGKAAGDSGGDAGRPCRPAMQYVDA